LPDQDNPFGWREPDNFRGCKRFHSLRIRKFSERGNGAQPFR
jgi:hypothetical protein